MEHSSLYDLIQSIQYGTNLHIGVLFFNNYGNEKCNLPHCHKIHSSKICDEIKKNKSEFRRCFTCRNLAIKKAITTKEPFGGICINGIYEYTHPVVVGKEVACIIFIGNILKDEGYAKLQKKLGEKNDLADSLEKGFTLQQCTVVGAVLESYIRFLLEKYKKQDSFKNPLVDSIINYLETNLEYDISTAHFTKIFHYNQQYLGRLFKKEMGVSIKEYILEQRLERAKFLLETGNETITVIASRVGFNNVTYFNRQFKRKFDLTPSQYRKR